jgi:hypothetical protein
VRVGNDTDCVLVFVFESAVHEFTPWNRMGYSTQGFQHDLLQPRH